mmetsp:Transcript_3549/g.7266  ORF Transcript_3549/g.7266 Transcript_3549/m.7266 type:complete len:395 (-) Transcript_3549:241-1425(-)
MTNNNNNNNNETPEQTERRLLRSFRQAAKYVPFEFSSDLATYTVQRPYGIPTNPQLFDLVSCQRRGRGNTNSNADRAASYAKRAHVSDKTTLEVAVVVKADNTPALIFGVAGIRYRTNGSSSNHNNNNNNAIGSAKRQIQQIRNTGAVIVPATTKQTTTALQMASKQKGGKKKKSKPKTSGGGFGGSSSSTTSTTTSPKPIRADKNALETQWDTFASVTDLEIKPLGDPDDEDYADFRVVDVFVRCGEGATSTSTGWFRVGKVCTSNDVPVEAALALQKGLILWTAVHMRRELLAKGKAAAQNLQLGYIAPAIIYMGTETDGPVEQDEVDAYLQVVEKAPPAMLLQASAAPQKSFGFRPDWNPPGFTYKRREKAALKDKSKKSSLDEIVESSSE